MAIKLTTFDILFNEALEELNGNMYDPKYLNIIRMIKDKHTPNNVRENLYNNLPTDIADKIRKEIEADDLKNTDHITTAPRGRKQYYVKKEYPEDIEAYKKFIKLYSNIIDPKIKSSISYNEDSYDINLPRYRSRRDKLIAVELGARNKTLYGSNKYNQNLGAKLKATFVNIAKIGDVDNEYINEFIRKIKENSPTPILRTNIVVPWIYLMELVNGNTEQQLAVLKLCSLTLEHNIFYYPKNDEERDVYKYFNSNIDKIRSWVMAGNNLKDIKSITPEEFAELEGAPLEIDDIEEDDFIVTSWNSVLEKEYPGESPAKVINAIKERNYMSDEEWNDASNDEKIDYLKYIKDWYYANKNK